MSDTHSTYVQTRPGGFFASCTTCGSAPFPDRRLLIDAEADASAHGNLLHAYDRGKLAAHEAACSPTQGGEDA